MSKKVKEGYLFDTIGVVAGAIIAIIGFLDKWPLEGKPELTLILVVASLLIFSTIGTALRQKTQMEKVTALAGRSASLANFHRFDSLTEANDYSFTFLEKAKKVVNTGIRPQDAYRNTEVATKEYYRNLFKKYKKGLYWRDIIPRFLVEEAEKIKEKYPTYDYAVLEVNLPIINFAVFETDNTNIVLFGWALSSRKGHEQNAFSTEDTWLVNYYKEYFELLWTYARPQEKPEAEKE